MYKNAKYTALEILEEAGVEYPLQMFGKTYISIGGLPVMNPYHVIRVPESAGALEVIVSGRLIEVPLEDSSEFQLSEGAAAALEQESASIKAATIQSDIERAEALGLTNIKK